MINRRNFLKTSALSSLGLLGFSGMTSLSRKALAAAPPLRITKIETVRFSPQLQVGGRGIQWMWVRLHTNEGIIGTGETYPFNEASEAAIKDLQWHSWMSKLLGSNPLNIEHTWDRIFEQNA